MTKGEAVEQRKNKKKEISFQALSETAHLNCTVAVHRGRGSAPRELQ